MHIGDFQHDQVTTRLEELACIGQGGLQRVRGVQHVGCDDQVVSAFGISLLAGRLFSIVGLVDHLARVLLEDILCLEEETGRHVGICVGGVLVPNLA